MFKCQRCGECCKTLPIDIGYGDITRWNKEGRKDILRRVSFIDNYPETGYGGFYFEETLLKKDRVKSPCPFFGESGCGIYETRPMACRYYPDNHKNGCSNFGPAREWKREIIDKKQKRDLQKALNHFDMMMTILKVARK